MDEPSAFSIMLTDLMAFLDGPGMPAGAILVSALFATTAAMLSIWWTRRTTRQRETIALILSVHWDKDYIEARNFFIEKRDSNEGLESCATDQKSDDFKKVAQILNHYEVMSVGINHGILCSKIYREWNMTRFVEDWRKSESLIASIRGRRENPRLFDQFERTAKKWQKRLK